MAHPPYLRATDGGVLLAVRLQPGAGREGIGAPHGDELRIRVTAPAHRGEANQALIQLLASTLQCAPRRIEIVRGAGSRQKTVRIAGVTLDEATELLRRCQAPS
ncbi:MAG TPA: DUF167 domain-containing protein [Myxococcota bacterium]|nr:DUF167 domain-containing protein [Myxococcota bacterium]